MAKKIITKFTVGTDESIDTLLVLTKTIATEKFSKLLETSALENYIAENFNKEALITEVNTMSNQWLIVYADDVPVGYARITSKGSRHEMLNQKRSIRIADFGILENFNDPAIIISLFQKCLSVCKSYERVWINEYLENPFIGFFESEGFIRQSELHHIDELPLPSIYLIREER